MSCPITTSGDGEIWLALGQSNMRYTNSESIKNNQYKSGVIVKRTDLLDPSLNISDWTPLEKSMNFPEVPAAFGRTLASRLEIPVRIYSGAVDSSFLSCWQKGGFCYAGYINPLIGESIKPRGIIWWQGESDGAVLRDEKTASQKEKYGAEFLQFVKTLRKEFGDPELKFIIVGLQKRCYNWKHFDTLETTPCEEYFGWQNVRNAQKQIAELDPNIEWVDASSFTKGELHPQYSYDKIGESLAVKAHELVYSGCQ